ncbi:class I SAM-dependent methyltransferase [Kitasatospora sp. NPDC056181]|uniref:class I SAM-dependent methyltransferase n=1 Tax=Kitasatospora sp. NPDC056181 TaxID=3345737 RepID=UPI0035DC58B6
MTAAAVGDDDSGHHGSSGLRNTWRVQMVSGELDLTGLRRVYGRPGSRLFYRAVCRNARHWGWTEPGQSKWRCWRAQRQLEGVLGRKLALPAGSRVLDAGCGSGVVARELAKRFGVRVTGVDVLDFHVREARRLSVRAALEDRTTFSWGDYHDLEFADGSFDGAYSMETLVHAYDPARALAEFHRVLRPGGRLVILGPVGAPREEMSPEGRAVLGPYLDAMSFPGAKRYDTRSLNELLIGAGFRIEEALDATARYRPTSDALYAYFRAPYALLRLFGPAERWLGMRSVVEMYQIRDYVSWYVHTAVKP